MKRIVKLGAKTLLLTAVLTLLITGAVFADGPAGPAGPAPNSGDCIPDQSGFEEPNGPNGDVGSGTGPVGPAPNSGDGESDGSGFE